MNEKGRVRFFPEHIVKRDPAFKTTGFWAQEEPTAPAMADMQTLITETDEPKKKTEGEQPITNHDKNKEEFVKYVSGVEDIATLEQLQKKYTQKWQTKAINDRIVELKSK